MIASLACVHLACVASSYPMLRDNGARGSFDTLFPSLVQALNRLPSIHHQPDLVHLACVAFGYHMYTCSPG
jgi:hypothetical protein